VSIETGVDEPGGRVDQWTDAAQAGLAFQPGDEVLAELHAFHRRSQNELTGMEDERISIVDLDQGC